MFLVINTNYCCMCMCLYVYICVNFRDKILLRGEECKTRENLNLSEKGQNGGFPLVYKLQNWNFSRSRMTKRTSPLDSLPRKILLNSVTVGFSRFFGEMGARWTTKTGFLRKSRKWKIN